MRHRDMRDAAGAEEGFLPREGAVNELIHKDKIARRHLLAERPASRDGDHIRDAEPLQRVDIGAVGDGGRAVDVTPPVTRQEGHRHPVERTRQNGVRRRAPGGLDAGPFRALKPVDVIDAGAADHGNFRLGHGGLLLR